MSNSAIERLGASHDYRLLTHLPWCAMDPGNPSHDANQLKETSSFVPFPNSSDYNFQRTCPWWQVLVARNNPLVPRIPIFPWDSIPGRFSF
jgi:hypothetical protein